MEQHGFQRDESGPKAETKTIAHMNSYTNSFAQRNADTIARYE